MNHAKLVPLIFVVVMFFVCPSGAQDINPGNHLQLKATNPAGVPLHSESKSSMFDRLPDGSIVKVLQTTNTNWIQVISETENLTGWIVNKYVGRVVPQPDGGGETPTEEIDHWDVWRSEELCEPAVVGGARLPRQSPQTLRIVTWNIRWFPRGTMYGDTPSKYTDQAWLSCTLAWLDADIIAVQEILNYTDAKIAMENVIDGLQGFNGGDWKLDLQDCGSGNDQHVGFIYNADRVKISGAKDMWQFNAKADDSGDSACKGKLRPGRYAYVESKANNGFDFHMIVVHTDSGDEVTDLANRNEVLERIDQVASRLISTDKDIIIIGDFNTMGTDAITPEEELTEFTSKVASENPGFTDVLIEPRCSEYYQGHGGWLDHIVVTANTSERNVQTAQVHGYCRMANCDRLSNMPSAYNVLSDHCPVVLDFLDQDID